MRPPRSVLGAVMAAVLASACSDSGPVLHLAVNGGFESGDFTGWTVDDAGGAGAFTVTSDISGFPSGLVILGPPESTYAAVTIQTGVGSHILYQDIALPAGKSARFRATIYLYNGHTAWVNSATAGLTHTGDGNQQFRVDIMSPSAGVRDVGTGVLLNVYQTMPGDPLTSGYVHLNTDLTPFAGQTIRIRFAEVDNLFYLHAAVDSVSVTAQ